MSSRPLKGGVVERQWADLLDVDYISPSPGVRRRFSVPKDARVDNNPTYNGQPWYSGQLFSQLDHAADLIPQRFKK